MKQVRPQNSPNQGERSCVIIAETSVIVGPETSFFFHPVARIYEFTLLLSSFTPTHVYARACAYTRVCVRGGEKEVGAVANARIGSLRRPGWPTFAWWRGSGLTSQERTRNASRGHTVARNGSAKLAGPIGTSRENSAVETTGSTTQLRQSLFAQSERPVLVFRKSLAMPTLANHRSASHRSPPPQPRDLVVVILVLVITTLLYLLLRSHISIPSPHEFETMSSSVAARK